MFHQQHIETWLWTAAKIHLNAIKASHVENYLILYIKDPAWKALYQIIRIKQGEYSKHVPVPKCQLLYKPMWQLISLIVGMKLWTALLQTYNISLIINISH